jgi:hypothetical protein
MARFYRGLATGAWPINCGLVCFISKVFDLLTALIKHGKA